MAIDFNGTNEFMRRTGSPVANVPITMACWFNSDSASAFQYLMNTPQYADGGGREFSIRLRGDAAGDYLEAVVDDNAPAAWATSTIGYSVGTWHHAVGVFASNTARHAYIDGRGKGTDTTNRPLTGTVDRVGMAGRYHSVANSGNGTLFLNGRLAEAAIWNAALIDAEITMLARGTSPLDIRPVSLVGYWPLKDKGGDSVDKVLRPYNMSWVNTPTPSTDHPRMLYRPGLWPGYNVTVTAGTPPTAPSDLTAVTASSSQINCAWTDNSADEDNFELDYDTSAAFDSPATTVSPAADAVSYNVTGLAASTLYYFRIRAVNGAGNSAYTASASDTTSAAVGSLLSLFEPGMSGGMQIMSGGMA